MAVVLTDRRFFSEEMAGKFRQINKELLVRPCKTQAELVRNVCEAEAIMTTSTPFSQRVINKLENCRVIVRCGIGVDTIDLAAATKKHIYVANTPGFYANEVADHAIALLLALSRKICLLNQLVRKGRYDFSRIQPVYRVDEKTVGLIGFGSIGRAIFEKMKGFHVQGLAYDPYVSGDSLTYSDLEMVELDQLLLESDFVSVCCPLTSETRGLLGEEQFKMMKRTAFVINTARGGIIDETALAKALCNGWIAGAGLDVLLDEPARKSNPLLESENVVVTPHVAWYSEESLRSMSREAAEEICRVFSGELPRNLVNRELGKITESNNT